MNAILVNKGQVVEWSAATSEFVAVVGEIRDPSLRMPLSVQALLQASAADDSVVRALLAKGNAVLARLRETEHREGERLGLRLAIEDVCELLGLELTADRRAFLERANLADLQTLRLKLKSQKTWPAACGRARLGNLATQQLVA